MQATPSAIAPVFAQFGRQFETKTRRHIADGAMEYFATDALTFTTSFRHTDREGTIPFGGSFGHSSLVEIPAPTQHTLSDVDAGAEYVRDPFLLRGGLHGIVVPQRRDLGDLRQSRSARPTSPRRRRAAA